MHARAVGEGGSGDAVVGCHVGANNVDGVRWCHAGQQFLSDVSGSGGVWV